MNPYTRSLLKQIKDPRLDRFVEHWDRLEALVILVYRQGAAASQDRTEHRRLRSWLKKNYPRWQPQLLSRQLFSLRPPTSIGGKLAREDPFEALLVVPDAAGFVQNWAAMQTLPAAREALNQLLISLSEQNKG